MKRIRVWLLIVLVVVALFSGCMTEDSLSSQNSSAQEQLSEEGSYNTKEEVALYLHLYGHLPDNYITKKEARNLG